MSPEGQIPHQNREISEEQLQSEATRLFQNAVESLKSIKDALHEKSSLFEDMDLTVNPEDDTITGIWKTVASTPFYGFEKGTWYYTSDGANDIHGKRYIGIQRFYKYPSEEESKRFYTQSIYITPDSLSNHTSNKAITSKNVYFSFQSFKAEKETAESDQFTNEESLSSENEAQTIHLIESFLNDMTAPESSLNS